MTMSVFWTESESTFAMPPVIGLNDGPPMDAFSRVALGASLLLSGLSAFTRVVAADHLTSGDVTLASLSDFQPTGANWQMAGGLGGDPRHAAVLVPVAGHGVLVNRPDKVDHKHLFSTWEHGDLEVDLEFLLPPGSNSGIYLMGRYEVQLFDSWKVIHPTSGDCGGIYKRWDASRGKGQEGYDGVAPRVNACRAPGLWQRLQIVFQAPRFDASGTKVQSALFRKVVLNGTLIHENVEATGPTRSAAFATEAAWGPLMIQGDHGSLALRSIHCRVPIVGKELQHEKSVRGKKPPRRGAPMPIRVEPTDRVLVQRGFVPWDPYKRLYACSVGSPAGLHFAYDFELGALLRLWRGGFLDTTEMWESRGEPQMARPTGATLDLLAKPSVALLEQPAVDGWPLSPGALFASDGYRLEPDGTPVFLSHLHSLNIEDRLVPASDQSGLVRTLVVSGRRSGWAAFVMLAESDTIKRVPEGFVIGDRAWYLDWPDASPHKPVIHTVHDRQMLLVPVIDETLGTPLVYTLVW